MRILLTYLFIGTYLLGMLQPYKPYLEFELRKDYIRDFLCINANQPITVCGGRCFLSKKMRDHQNNTEDSLPPGHLDLKEYPIGFVLIYEDQFLRTEGNCANYQPYLEKLSDTHSSEVFRPPILLV